MVRKPSGTYLINYRKKGTTSGGFINVKAKNRKELLKLAKERNYTLLSAKRNYLK